MMVKKIVMWLAVVMMMLSLSACAGTGMNKEVGGLLGSVAGAVIGHDIGGDEFGSIIGSQIGEQLGRTIGAAMDQQDLARVQVAYERTPDQQPVAWQNPNTGNSYTVTPQSTYYNPNNNPCRRAEIESIIQGRREVVVSTACRDGSGQWIAQN